MRLASVISSWFLLIAGLLVGSPAHAAIEISRDSRPAVTITDVYQRDGVAFVAIDEVLNALGLSGAWDNVEHLYRINTPQGVAVISPGSSYLRFGERAVKVEHRPRFIDGKLRVAEPFLTEQLLPLLDLPVQVKNLHPPAPPPQESPLDQLFSLLLLQRPKATLDSQWVVAIDPGHGGQDTGALGKDGTTEQAVNLAVARQLQKMLKMRREAPVVMTRDADYAVSLSQRLEAVTRGQADVLLALHTQAGFSPLAQGVMLFLSAELATPPGADATAGTMPAAVPGSNASRQLAEALRDAFTAAGFQVAPIQERSLLPLGQGNLPRVLVELGYLSNELELGRLQDPVRQQLLAQALYNGLENFQRNFQNLQEPEDEPSQPAAQQ
jgi:N-acetylmuramoyl-L-alanine amidase